MWRWRQREEAGERRVRVGRSLQAHSGPALTCLAPSHTSGLTSSWDNSRVGKLRGLCLTREPLWSQVSRSVTLGSPMAQKAWGGELGWSAGLSLSLQGKQQRLQPGPDPSLQLSLGGLLTAVINTSSSCLSPSFPPSFVALNIYFISSVSSFSSPFLQQIFMECLAL